MSRCATILALVTLGALETGLDPIKTLDAIRRVDAFGFVIDHVSQFGLQKPTVIDVSGYGKTISSGLTDSSKHIIEEAFLPGRNKQPCATDVHGGRRGPG